ncbi:myelin and lymphocyte protein isoform X1 [Pezoporus wallicus]|uniref:myelin and lymphocyte protein isoform X1 n=1 Tax=Pezoporus wallicus TaxID=35540 RepID=UPI00254D9128|nr:myelin and lymphocyte protein isoform X1 [Pezoporus wallicus]XP_061317348.1 myelin and lymphocyte protein isoform X1 [Pezoporus flaviventris]
MSSPGSTTSLPSGLSVLTTFPDVLFIPEIIFGGLVWILVASSKVPLPMVQGWVMFVSVFCFVMSTILLCLYICSVHGGSSFWVTLDAICQSTAALFYLSAAVLEAYSTYIFGFPVIPANRYRENIAAVVSACQAGEGRQGGGCGAASRANLYLHQSSRDGAEKLVPVLLCMNASRHVRVNRNIMHHEVFA